MASPLLLVIGYCMFCAFTMCREMWMAGLKKMCLSAHNREVDRLPPSRVTADFY